MDTVTALPKNLLPFGKKVQIAYMLTLLDGALIRSNGPDDVMTRIVNNEDFFLIPTSKIRHTEREFMERIQRTAGIGTACRAQNYCSRCIACFLFGSFGAAGDNKADWSCHHRIKMTDALAMKPGVDTEMRTINSVDPKDQQTHTSLTKTFSVPAGTQFYGTVTLDFDNEEALHLVLASMLGIDHIGARTANCGTCTVTLLGLRRGEAERADWSPWMVTTTGKMPTFDPASLPFTDLDSVDLDALVTSFYANIVKPTIDGLEKVINDSKSKDVVGILRGLFNRTNPNERDVKVVCTNLNALAKTLKTIPEAAEVMGKVKELAKSLKDATTLTDEVKTRGVEILMDAEVFTTPAELVS
jgi:CRISPR type I-D-associated protein Csc2